MPPKKRTSKVPNDIEFIRKHKKQLQTPRSQKTPDDFEAIKILKKVLKQSGYKIIW